MPSWLRFRRLLAARDLPTRGNLHTRAAKNLGHLSDRSSTRGCERRVRVQKMNCIPWDRSKWKIILQLLQLQLSWIPKTLGMNGESKKQSRAPRARSRNAVIGGTERAETHRRSSSSPPSRKLNFHYAIKVGERWESYWVKRPFHRRIGDPRSCLCSLVGRPTLTGFQFQ